MHLKLLILMLKKTVILLLDEIHIRDGLVYDKHTGTLLGFSNLGDINIFIYISTIHCCPSPPLLSVDRGLIIRPRYLLSHGCFSVSMLVSILYTQNRADLSYCMVQE